MRALSTLSARRDSELKEIHSIWRQRNHGILPVDGSALYGCIFTMRQIYHRRLVLTT